MWSIYSKRFEFMVYTFICAFWGPLNLLGPSKKSRILDSWPLSVPYKTRSWNNLFWKCCPVSKAQKSFAKGCNNSPQKAWELELGGTPKVRWEGTHFTHNYGQFCQRFSRCIMDCLFVWSEDPVKLRAFNTRYLFFF